MAHATVGKSSSPVINQAINVAKDSNKPMTGSVQSMLNSHPTKHPLKLPIK